MSASGYAHPMYGYSLEEFGRPRQLPCSGAMILERDVPGSALRDAMGCYPLFDSPNWQGLFADLENVRDLVSLAVVLPPFVKNCSEDYLSLCFPDLLRNFKQHFVVDLSERLEEFVSNHHRRNAKRALREVVVDVVKEPVLLLNEWCELYGNLVQRHEIGGLRVFSPWSFAVQLATPGMLVLKAHRGGDPVSMLLWYIQDDVAYYHLGASSPEGYEHKASFALFWESLVYFRWWGLSRVSLGGAAGLVDTETDGLARFKRGWSTDVMWSRIAGRVFQRDEYARLVELRGAGDSPYFPAYRTGEFT